MKRERYFQDELWRMFVTYAILPAALFTFICGVLFMTVLLHGRERANREYLSYVNGRVNQIPVPVLNYTHPHKGLPAE